MSQNHSLKQVQCKLCGSLQGFSFVEVESFLCLTCPLSEFIRQDAPSKKKRRYKSWSDESVLETAKDSDFLGFITLKPHMYSDMPLEDLDPGCYKFGKSPGILDHSYSLRGGFPKRAGSIKAVRVMNSEEDTIAALYEFDEFYLVDIPSDR